MQTVAPELAWRPDAAERVTRPPPMREGDIRSIQPLVGLEGPSRLALVVRAPSGRDRAEIMLAHERVDMVGPDDVVLRPESPELPNGLVVQTRLRGIVWRLQVSTFLGRLSSPQMASVTSTATSARSVKAETDTAPLPEQDDGSWTDFHESQLQALWALTGDCADATLDDDAPWRIDAGLLSVECLDLHNDPATILTEVIHILRTRKVVASFGDLEALHASGATDASTWGRTKYGSDLASQIALSVRILIESSLTHLPDYSNIRLESTATVLSERSGTATALTMLPSERLVTAPFLWTDSGAELLCPDHDSNSQSSQHVEVMMLATPESNSDSPWDPTNGN